MRRLLRQTAPRLRRFDLFAGVAALLLAAALAGCSPAASDKLVIRGSNTVGEDLAPHLIAAYAKDHPGTGFDTEFKGTGYGIAGLIVHRCDIGAASRDTSTNEVAMARDLGVEFDNALIGSYAVAVIVNSSNPLSSLTLQQVRDLFTGAIQSWKEIGGPDAQVHLCIRNPISGTYLGFRELAMENKPYALSVKTFTNDTELANAVGQDPGAIGYTCFQADSKGGVKPLAIGAAIPSAATVREGKYPYCRALHLFTNKGDSPAAARQFVAFVQSPDGQKVVEERGFVTVK